MNSVLNIHKDFPKKEFPTETHNELYSGRQYSLALKSTSSTRSFNLGVYNLFPLDLSSNSASSSYIIPVDPSCLVTLMSILCKDGCKFPTINDEIVSLNNNNKNHTEPASISILSYQSATDDQLPLLVEDSKDQVNHKIIRKIKYSKIINILNSSKLTLNDELSFNLINEQLFDFYNLLILNLSDYKLLEYYSLFRYNFTPNLQSLSLLSKFIASSVRQHLLKRNDFHLRNPNTFNYFSSLVNPKYTKLAFQSEYKKIVRNGRDLLADFNKVFEKSKYWSSDDQDTAGIIDFQLASYIYCMKHLSNDVAEFAEILDVNAFLVSHSENIILSFI